MSPDAEVYEEYKDAVYKKDGVEIIPPIEIDYKGLKKVGLQRYFDSLFDVDLFSALLNELLLHLNNDKVSYDDLKNAYFDIDRVERCEELLQVVWAIDDCTFEDRKVCNFLHYVHWETFSISNIHAVLHREYEHLSISTSQREFIESYCHKSIKEKSLSSQITYHKDSGFTYTYVSSRVVFFASYFSFKLCKSTLLDMLLLPSYMFFHKENDYNLVVPLYLANHLSTKEISDQIKNNLQNVELIGDNAYSHIRFCLENNLDYAIDLAITSFLDSEVCEIHRRTAFDYLLQLNGTQYIYDTFLPSSDSVLLQIIAEQLAAEQNNELELCLIEQNKNSDDAFLFMKSLIVMNSEYGIEKYYLLAKENHSIPDYSERGNLGSLTEAIKVVKQLKLLPHLYSLLLLLFTPDFRDADSFGLFNSLYSAFKNIAEADFGTVRNMLSDVLENSSEGSNIRAFCNPLLDEIVMLHSMKSDVPWSVRDVCEFLSNEC
jgi:hypothetical protein